MDASMQLTAIEEHDTAPWNPLGEAMEEVGRWRVPTAPRARKAAGYV